MRRPAPVRPIYVPIALFGGGVAATAARNIEHQAMFRLGMLTDIAAGILENIE